MFSSTDPGARAGTLDELRRVIRRIEGTRPFRVAPEPAETVLGGQLVETDAGPILTVRREFPFDHRHGRVALEGALSVSAEALRVLTRDAALPDARRLLFLDTETTGLSGGTGTYAFLVGAGFIEDDRFVVVQHFMRDLDEEPALLAAVAPLLERASGVVTFNGSGFDVPLLETRFILGRRRWPATLLHMDLMHPARRVWAARFVDCRLGTLEREVLGHQREDDVPGSLIPSLYFDFLRRRHAGPLARVFTHNCDDVLSLVALLAWVGLGADGLSAGSATPSPTANTVLTTASTWRAWVGCGSASIPIAPPPATAARSPSASPRPRPTPCGSASRPGKSASPAGMPPAFSGKRPRPRNPSTLAPGKSSPNTTNTAPATSSRPTR